uniref:Uncharacterized protein n=1 Tax=Zea mays TaxID=4577 RepID=C4IZJ7_MAIZE|nr:unknown [Zea mays]
MQLQVIENSFCR